MRPNTIYSTLLLYIRTKCVNDKITNSLGTVCVCFVHLLKRRRSLFKLFLVCRWQHPVWHKSSLSLTQCIGPHCMCIYVSYGRVHHTTHHPCTQHVPPIRKQCVYQSILSKSGPINYERISAVWFRGLFAKYIAAPTHIYVYSQL